MPRLDDDDEAFDSQEEPESRDNEEDDEGHTEDNEDLSQLDPETLKATLKSQARFYSELRSITYILIP